MMRILPSINYPEVFQNEIGPSKTFKLDPETQKITSIIDNKEAIYQFIRITLQIKRYAHLIYPDDVGFELFDLLGKGFSNEFIISEIPRLVSEALIVDDRIHRVYDFVVDIHEDELTIAFKADTVEGVLPVNEVVQLV